MYAILSLANNMHIRQMVLIWLFILIGHLHLHGMCFICGFKNGPQIDISSTFNYKDVRYAKAKFVVRLGHFESISLHETT